MRVLVIGAGGREHVLGWKISQNPALEEIYFLPGNGGTLGLGENIPCNPLDLESVVCLAEEKRIDLTVVGPEAPLVAGLVDVFEKKGLKIFGPRKEAALIEGSKVFAKKLLEKYGIPTGKAKVFDDYQEAVEHLKGADFPLVVKADGLAEGKGVTVCQTYEEAVKALGDCFLKKRFGEAGSQVLIEEYLEGEEFSLFVLTDGENVLPLLPAQDYKRVYEGDQGPNTGGMGSYAPPPFVTEEVKAEALEKVARPVIEAMKKEGREYKGLLYCGLILTSQGVKVLEFNCRFGDPESQAILPLLESDLLEVMLSVVEGNFRNYKLNWKKAVGLTVVLASRGYPLSYQTGFEISGLEEAKKIEGVEIFQAGTRRENGKLVTAGGRVLNVTAVGKDFNEARERVYKAIGRISFEGMHFRKDIALKAVRGFENGEKGGNHLGKPGR